MTTVMDLFSHNSARDDGGRRDFQYERGLPQHPRALETSKFLVSKKSQVIRLALTQTGRVAMEKQNSSAGLWTIICRMPKKMCRKGHAHGCL